MKVVATNHDPRRQCWIGLLIVVDLGMAPSSLERSMWPTHLGILTTVSKRHISLGLPWYSGTDRRVG